MLMTDPLILVWGEPVARLGVLAHLTDIVAGVCGDWPRGGRYVSQREPVSLTQDWIVNLSPDAADFRSGLRGLRGLMDGWLAAPARRRGFTRVGGQGGPLAGRGRPAAALVLSEEPVVVTA